MRYWLSTILLLAFPTLAQADDPRCMLSFDSARLDTCSGEVKLANDALAPLADLVAHAGSTLRLVKFEGPIQAGQRHALEARGARIIGYAPHHAFLVRMSPALDAGVRTIQGVTWTGPFLPAFKVDVNIASDLGGTDIVRAGGVHSLTVALLPGADAAAARSTLLAGPGIAFRFTEQGHDHERLVVSFDHDSLAQAVAHLASHPEVTSVSLRWDAEFMNSQAGWLHQSGTNSGPSQLPIFERGLFGCGQVVAAADSGLHAANCSFADAGFGTPVTSVCASGASCTATTPDFNHRKVGAHYKWDGSTTGGPADGHGHGTHVMGSMAGNNPASAVDCANLTTPGGLTNLDGTAPGAKIISQEMGASLQYLNSLGGTIYHAASIAYQNGARIHNNSWGSSCRSGGSCIAGCQVEYRQTTRDADAMVWEFPEMALFVAAGNSGGLGGSTGCGPGADVGSAGNAKNVFSIGSNNRGTGGDAMSSFSSRGPTQDRRSKPDLTAQGASIVSSSRTACGTTSMSGTSMATPTAAGLAALVRDYLARGFYPGGAANTGNAINNPSAALVKAIMIAGARSITGAGTTGGAPSQSQGWGRIHLDDALFFTGDARNLWLHDGTAGLQTGAVDSHVLAVAAGQPLVVALTWHDAPALVNANPHTVNLLRLEVQAPNGDIWTQKLPATGGLNSPNPLQDTTTSNYDDLNNVHQIRIASPQAGTWQVRVRGIQVAQGPQPYALAATGALTGVSDPDFQLQATPGSFAMCAGDNASVEIGVLGLEGFNDPVTLSLSGLPGPATGSFSGNPVVPANPAATSTLTLANTGSLPAGPLNLTVDGQSSGPGFPATSRSVNIAVTVSAGTPAVATPATPGNGATGQPLQPAFTWSAVAGASSYRFELATDPGFSNIVIDTTLPGTSYSPPAPLANSTDHWWRVTATNTCGSSAASAVFSFRTLGQPGECDAGATPFDVFTEDFTGGLGGFSTAGSVGASTWALSAVRPSPLSGGNAVLAVDIATVSDQRLTSPTIALPAADLPLTLKFQNWRNIENNGMAACYDGGILEVSVNGGAFTQLTGAALLNDPYRGPVSASFSNPLAGLNAWCEPAPGRPYADTLVDLSPYAGSNVQLRWRLGTDTSVAREGWYVDDIRVQACTSGPTADLSVVLTDSPDPVDAGDPIAFTAQVANAGPATADAVVLDVSVDPVFAIGSAAGSGWSCTVASATEASCTRASLAVGSAPPVVVQAIVDAAAASGTYTSTAQVSASTGDGDPSNNLDDETTTVIGGPTDLIFANGFECAAGLPDCPTGPVVLFDEYTGRFVTSPDGGAGGAPISALQTALGMSVFGAGSQISANNWVADDFVVPAGGWTIERFKVYSYQTGSTTTPSHNDLRLRIWADDPNTGSLVFGDTTTNRLSSVTFTGVYRVTDTATTGTTRPVMELVAEINPPLVLPAGTYWLGWAAGGTVASGPWAPPQTVVGQTTTGNGQQSIAGAAFAPYNDTGSATQQGFPLVLEGTQ